MVRLNGWRGWVLCGLCLILLWSVGALADTPESRLALVIGNAQYPLLQARPLETSLADARAMKTALELRGFKIIYQENADRRTMYAAIGEFLKRLDDKTIGFVYYAGHGVQISHSNYLIPSDMKMRSPDDVPDDAIDMGQLLDNISKAHAKYSIVIIDACRTNPFNPVVRGISAGGLAPITTNASGILIAYSAGPDESAIDRLGPNDTNPNGLFTRELLKAMNVTGVKIQDVLQATKKAVHDQAKAVGLEQWPMIVDQSLGTFYFAAPVVENHGPLQKLLDAVAERQKR